MVSSCVHMFVSVDDIRCSNAGHRAAAGSCHLCGGTPAEKEMTVFRNSYCACSTRKSSTGVAHPSAPIQAGAR